MLTRDVASNFAKVTSKVESNFNQVTFLTLNNFGELLCKLYLKCGKDHVSSDTLKWYFDGSTLPWNHNLAVLDISDFDGSWTYPCWPIVGGV